MDSSNWATRRPIGGRWRVKKRNVNVSSRNCSYFAQLEQPKACDCAASDNPKTHPAGGRRGRNRARFVRLRRKFVKLKAYECAVGLERMGSCTAVGYGHGFGGALPGWRAGRLGRIN